MYIYKKKQIDNYLVEIIHDKIIHAHEFMYIFTIYISNEFLL